MSVFTAFEPQIINFSQFIPYRKTPQVLRVIIPRGMPYRTITTDDGDIFSVPLYLFFLLPSERIPNPIDGVLGTISRWSRQRFGNSIGIFKERLYRDLRQFNYVNEGDIRYLVMLEMFWDVIDMFDGIFSEKRPFTVTDSGEKLDSNWDCFDSIDLKEGEIISGSLAVSLYYGLGFTTYDVDIITEAHPTYKGYVGKDDATPRTYEGSHIPGLRGIYNNQMGGKNGDYLQYLFVENAHKFIDSFDLDICKIKLTKSPDGGAVFEHLHGRRSDDLEIRFDTNYDPLRGRKTCYEVARVLTRLKKYTSRGFYLRRGDLSRIMRLCIPQSLIPTVSCGPV